MTNQIYKGQSKQDEFVSSLLNHKENGYKDGYWVNWASRENQLRYYEKVKEGSTLENDGLNSLRYSVKSLSSKQNYHHLLVTL